MFPLFHAMFNRQLIAINGEPKPPFTETPSCIYGKIFVTLRAM